MSELTLYGYYRSSCSYRVRIALELKGLAYDYQAVHLVKDGGEHKQKAYLALNPMGQVPCLIHRQRAIAQSVAIIEYLEALFPEYKLFPEDPYDQACVRQLCENINSGIQPVQNLGVLKRLQSQFMADEAAKGAWVRHWIQLGFEALEQELAATAGDFCFGNRPGVVDCFLVPQVYNALRFELPMAAFPIISRINTHCLSLPAFQKADPPFNPMHLNKAAGDQLQTALAPQSASFPSDSSLSLRLSPRLTNLLSALVPTLEGMWLFSVIPGKRGEALLRYHDTFTADIEAMLAYLTQTYPGELHRISHTALIDS